MVYDSISSVTVHEINISHSRARYFPVVIVFIIRHATVDITHIPCIITDQVYASSILLEYPATWLSLSPGMGKARSVEELNLPGAALTQA